MSLQISYHNGVSPSAMAEEKIRERAEKLMQLYHRITSCRVVIDQPHKHHQHGGLYRVHIELNVPGETLIVDRSPDEDQSHADLLVATRDAFDAARRELQRYLERQRNFEAERT